MPMPTSTSVLRMSRNSLFGTAKALRSPLLPVISLAATSFRSILNSFLTAADEPSPNPLPSRSSTDDPANSMHPPACNCHEAHEEGDPCGGLWHRRDRGERGVIDDDAARSKSVTAHRREAFDTEGHGGACTCCLRGQVHDAAGRCEAIERDALGTCLKKECEGRAGRFLSRGNRRDIA